MRSATRRYSWLRRVPDDELLPVDELPDPLPLSLRAERPLLDVSDPLDDERLPVPDIDDSEGPVSPDQRLSSPRRIRSRLSTSLTPGIESTISSIMYFE